MSHDDVKKLNEVLFAALDTPVAARAADSVSSFTRFLMYLPFTGMPRRSLMRRIMPPVDVHPAAELERRGWPYDPDEVFEHEGERFAAHLFDRGALYYEIEEDDLAAADYARRLAGRRVSRREWRDRTSAARNLARLNDPEAAARRVAQDAGFKAVMGSLLSQIRILGERV